MLLGRRKRMGHAKEVALQFERQVQAAKRAQELLAKRVPKSISMIKLLSPMEKRRRRLFNWNPFLPSAELCLKEKIPANENTSPFSNGHYFGQWLKKKGFSYLGSGAHSQVYGKKDSKRVIKVGSSGDNWMNYVMWGRSKGYEGTFVPKVYSYKWHDAGFYVAVVEKLERTTNKGSSKKDLDPVLLDLFGAGYRGNEYALLAMDALVPGLDKFTLDIKAAANDNGWREDIHGGNFMVRADGSWVATDPINAHGNPMKTRLRSAA